MASILPHPRVHSSAQFRIAPAPLRYWHLASLDAATVAVVWRLGFCWAAGVRASPSGLALAALVVWVVYVADRVLDARKSLRGARSEMRERHWFHWRHRRRLIPLAALAACTAAVLAFPTIPARAREHATLIGLASFIYLARVHGGSARVVSKELLVGVLFTAGCAFPAWSHAIAAPVVFFALLAWLNCWAIERWEQLRPGFAVALAAFALAAAGLLLSAFCLATNPRAVALLVAGSVAAAVLAALDRLRNRLTVVDLRALADLALLTPATVLIAAWLRQ